MTSHLFIYPGSILTNDAVLVRILGLFPFLGAPTKLETATGMGAETTFIMKS